MSTLARLGLFGITLAACLRATTLEQLSLNEMTAKSTGVVRAKVTSTYTATRGADIYTFYKLAVSETWKGATPAGLEVAIPGGVMRGIRQIMAGAPYLTPGNEYVLFLWTSKSGLTQVIGMSQGLFQVQQDSSGKLIAAHASSTEPMLDHNGNAVQDSSIAISVADLKRRVRGVKQ